MSYEIFHSLPMHEVIIDNDGQQEIFRLFQCGIFSSNDSAECVELVELTAQSHYRLHKHKTSAATIYIIHGEGDLLLAGDTIRYQPAMKILIPENTWHGFHTHSKTLFLSIQSPPIIDKVTQQVDIHYDNELSTD